MAFVRRMWSGKHHRTIKGMGLITLIWTNGTAFIPIDFRIYNIDEDDKKGMSWFESTMKIRREAVTGYFNNPLYILN
jgi:hypothetical protein